MRTLYSYFRSSAAYRVRIALNHKQLDYALEPVHLLKEGGEQFSARYLRLNPQARVPTLVDGEHVLTQSLAIVEYLDEAYPQHPLLPADRPGRARVRALAQIVACDIHPLGNLSVLQYLAGRLGVDEEGRRAWARHWIALGLQGYEAQLAADPDSGPFSHGDTPTLADCCLVPQLFNARRFDCPLDAYPRLLAVEKNCLALPQFARAAPQCQPDAA